MISLNDYPGQLLDFTTCNLVLGFHHWATLYKTCWMRRWIKLSNCVILKILKTKEHGCVIHAGHGMPWCSFQNTSAIQDWDIPKKHVSLLLSTVSKFLISISSLWLQINTGMSNPVTKILTLARQTGMSSLFFTSTALVLTRAKETIWFYNLFPWIQLWHLHYSAVNTKSQEQYTFTSNLS